MELSNRGRQIEFAEVPDLPVGGIWAVAANERHLLVGNNTGVFLRNQAGFEAIPGMPAASRLFLPEPDLCIVVGAETIAAMRYIDGEWRECAARTAGFGFPSVALPVGNSLWIELGLNQAARVWFEDGVLRKQLFTDFPWDEPVWINIGHIGKHVLLSGTGNERVYVDRRTGQPVPPPPLENALAEVGVTILRIAEGLGGVVWITHPNGVITMRPTPTGYQIDDKSLARIRDLYPVITLQGDQHAWISTESALYHVPQDFTPRNEQPQQPFLVSIKDGKTGEELFSAARNTSPLTRLPFARNHLVFRYFSGGYSGKRNPAYEFSMVSGTDTWKVESADPTLTLPQLTEGRYQLTAQLMDGPDPVGEPVVTTFVLHPPWYRSPAAFLVYGAALIVLCMSAMVWAIGRTKRKHNYLERLVQDRTEELRATMDKLTEEARTSATLTERNRLAGEIHDSLQQGLSGLALHLDTTLKTNQLDESIRSRLTLARRMVSYTRDEVQQAVWDLESPLLQNDNLSEALEQLAALIGNETTIIDVEASGSEPRIPSAIKHHLLRIAQEAITNAVRHSGASRVHVRLVYAESQVQVAVKDDGCGFVPGEVLDGGIGHFGLRGLRSRAQKIQGDLRIDSQVGQGTHVHVRVPLNSTVTV
jgi:signal transduction histidine kinase